MAGDAVVVMMADESDDCRDVIRYWNKISVLDPNPALISSTK